MLNLKKLLTKVLNLAVNPRSATIASGASGEVYYLHFGRLCVVSGAVTINGAMTASQNIASGLPRGLTGSVNYNLRATNANAVNENVDLFITYDGYIRNREALASANRSLRFCGAYLTQNVGGGTA